MSELVQQPEPMTRAQMVELFTDLLMRIDLGDSFEGWVEWAMPDTTAPDDVVAMVTARYRIGNREGQGGMRFIGPLVEKGT